MVAMQQQTSTAVKMPQVRAKTFFRLCWLIYTVMFPMGIHLAARQHAAALFEWLELSMHMSTAHHMCKAGCAVADIWLRSDSCMMTGCAVWRKTCNMWCNCFPVNMMETGIQ